MIYPLFILAQAPESFNYQAVVKDNSGELLLNTLVSIRISVIDQSSSGTLIYQEVHSTTTNDYGLINLKIGSQSPITGVFSDIEWNSGPKFMKVEIDDGDGYDNMGTLQLLSVPYALYAKSAEQAESLGQNNVYSTQADTLFVVKDHDGNVIFAVYPDGAELIVNKQAKGRVGGFAVSGRSPGKENTEDYLIISPDSARIYVNEPAEKGTVGGFAVSGRSPAKEIIGTLMNLTKDNYFIGHEAGKSNTDGLYNSFIGYKTGYSNTIGERNTFLGYFSGYTNINGDGNIFIGDSAGYANETGNNNIFIGNTAGKSNVSGFNNVLLGNESGYGNIDGKYNVFIGDKTGVKNSSGKQNVIIGATSGYYNSIGFRNVFVGNWCGYNNTEGSDNIFLGNQSGWNNTEGSSNIFAGSFSGFNNTTAQNNIFIGNSSGFSNEDGSENIFIGKESGYSNINGTLNVCIGFQSGYSLTSGNYNSYLGFWAGRGNTTGTYNTFIGPRAGMNVASGNKNVVIGYMAGRSVTGDSKLAIADNDTLNLIYGEFNNKKVIITDKLVIGIDPYSNTLSVNGPMQLGADGTTINNIIRHTYTSVGTGAIEQFSAFVFSPISVSGAQVGATVYVSPGTDLPDGIVISYARVIAEGNSYYQNSKYNKSNFRDYRYGWMVFNHN